MNRKSLKKLKIDTRLAEDIEDRISELAESYDTGWHLDRENPDIGTALVHVFAGQMEENIDRVNEVLDRYHTEFVNMLDISLLPARPASGMVVMNVIADTIDGTGVARGTKFLTNGEDPYVFEAEHSIYVTSSEISMVFMTDFKDGTIGYVKEAEESLKPFILFGSCDEYPRSEVTFYHPYMFNAMGDDLFMRIKTDGDFVEMIQKGMFQFSYAGAGGETVIDDYELADDNETFVLRMNMMPVVAKEKVELVVEGEGEDEDAAADEDNESMYALKLSAVGPVEKSVKVESITFSAKGNLQPPENVTNGLNDLEVEKFLPFSDTLSLYATCFIGSDRCFSKAGALITMEFTLEFNENRISLTQEEVDESLKIVKRRPASIRNEAYTDTYIDEVAVEYYNGVGWRRLEITGGGAQMFDSSSAGKMEISFICPSDWEETAAGSYDGRCIRLQITKSDNCYLRPAVHHYPVIKDIVLSYSYEARYEPAKKAIAISGTSVKDVTTAQYQGKPYVVFTVSEYMEDALYIGLTKRIESGPASILFEMEEGVRYNGVKANFAYSSMDGFKQMKVLDYTEDFSKTGVIAFMPPSDWTPRELEGQNLFWLKIMRHQKEEPNEDENVLPKIRDIALNAVAVANIETKEEESVYIEEVMPNMRFTLGATGVLNADVWVNEMGRFSQETMNAWAMTDPANVVLEKDARGVITAIFVRWQEVEHFETASTKRSYQLDRLNNELIFGDGVHTWIPSVLDDVAVKFTVRCCNGSVGNVEAGTITDTRDFLMYVGAVSNPIKAYGGSDIESLDNALERGASILSSRYRLISMDDYIRAIMAYSDTIDACVGISGETVEGEIDEASMTFVLLMKEFEEGSYAFHRVVGGLKRFLLTQSELTVVPDKLHIIEPIYVRISVIVWVTVVELDDSFEIQNMLEDCLNEYLSPLGYGSGGGWRIGTLPKKPQILMRLGILKSRAIIRKSVMVASYRDSEGDHEVDLDELEVTPFMVTRSGEHKVHILY